MKIRRFRIGDEAALFRVFFTAIHSVARHDYTPAQIEAWAPEDFDADLWTAHIRGIDPFVVERDDKIVAYADVQKTGYIDHFFVSGTHPRQGIGKLLMDRLHEEAEKLCLVELTSDVSRTAEPFFARQGFHMVERRFPVRRGVTIPNALMSKQLKHTG